MFTMLTGERLRCVNPDCQAEIEVTKDSINGASNPRCCCGAEMKRPYSKPVVRKLDRKEAEALLAQMSARERG